MGTIYKVAFPARGSAAWKADQRPVYEGAGGAIVPTYLGILDQLSKVPVQAASMNFRLTHSYIGGPMYLRNKTNGAEFEVAFDGSGVTDYAAVIAELGGHVGAVVRIHDQVGNASAEQLNTSLQGEFVPDDFGGRAVAFYSSTAKQSRGALPSGPTGNGDHAIVYVGRALTVGWGDYRRFVGLGDFSSSSAIEKSVGGGGTPQRWAWGGGFNSGKTGSLDANNQPHVFVKRHTSGTTVGRVDGAQDYSGTITYNLDALGFAWNNDGAPANNFGNDSKAAEVWFFNGTITDNDVALIEAWAADKYGIALA